jgi:hypothetical protein
MDGDDIFCLRQGSSYQGSGSSSSYLLYGLFKIPRGLCQHIDALIRKFGGAARQENKKRLGFHGKR